VNQRFKQEVNWEFLLGSSKSTLQAYEQSRLNFAANLRKEISQLLDVWVDESSNALLARWLIERNFAADAAAISTNGGSAPSVTSEIQALRPPVACGPQGAPKPPSRTAPHVGAVTSNASDKIFGDKPFATPRIHVAS
jgi:hypothetical protein